MSAKCRMRPSRTASIRLGKSDATVSIPSASSLVAGSTAFELEGQPVSPGKMRGPWWAENNKHEPSLTQHSAKLGEGLGQNGSGEGVAVCQGGGRQSGGLSRRNCSVTCDFGCQCRHFQTALRKLERQRLGCPKKKVSIRVSSWWCLKAKSNSLLVAALLRAKLW